MREDRGNMWDMEADAFVITTNGFVKNICKILDDRFIVVTF